MAIDLAASPTAIRETDTRPSPWHPGEITLQQTVGVVDRMDKRGPQVIRDHLTAQQREFFASLPYIVLGSVDPEGQPWATLRDGDVGFMRVENERLLHIGIDSRPLDPAQSGISDGCAIGTLGIQLETRRRNRANGTVSHMSSDGFDIQIEHSFGNCAQYIWMRHPQLDPPAEVAIVEQVEISDALNIGHITTIREADTFFVASYADCDDGTKQVDVSHRGGHAGFFEVSHGCLTIPDYAGNKFFNTLGNIILNSKAGLTFPDFSDGTLLQMTGDAEVIFGSERIANIPGAERLWRFRPRKIVRRSSAFALRWTLNAAAAPALPERAIT